MHSTYIDELDNDLLSCENLTAAIDDPKWLLEYSKEDDDDGEGFFGTIWAFIKKIFSAIGGFFSRLFGGSDDEDVDREDVIRARNKNENDYNRLQKNTTALINKVRALNDNEFNKLLNTTIKIPVISRDSQEQAFNEVLKLSSAYAEWLYTSLEVINKKITSTTFEAKTDKEKIAAVKEDNKNITGVAEYMKTGRDTFKKEVSDFKHKYLNVTDSKESITYREYLNNLKLSVNNRDDLVNILSTSIENIDTLYSGSQKKIYDDLGKFVDKYRTLKQRILQREKELKKFPDDEFLKLITIWFKEFARLEQMCISTMATFMSLNVYYKRILSNFIKVTNSCVFTLNDQKALPAKESFSTLYTEENNIVDFIYKKDREDNYNKHLLHVQDIVNETLEHVSSIKYNLSTLTIDEVSPLSKSTYLKWHTTANLALSTLINAIKDDNANKELTCKDVATKLKSIGIALSSDLSRFTADTPKVCRTFTSLEAMIPVSAYKLAYKENDTDIEKLYVDTESTLSDLYLNLKNMNININTPNDAYLFKSLMHLVSVCSFTISELGNNMCKMYSY